MKDYHDTNGLECDGPMALGYTSIAVLPFLNGRKWDERALGFVYALRPSKIRVTYGEEKLNSVSWRVTVRVDRDDVIRSVTQEVQVGLAPGWRYGEDARLWMEGA